MKTQESGQPIYGVPMAYDLHDDETDTVRSQYHDLVLEYAIEKSSKIGRHDDPNKFSVKDFPRWIRKHELYTQGTEFEKETLEKLLATNEIVNKRRSQQLRCMIKVRWALRFSHHRLCDKWQGAFHKDRFKYRGYYDE